MPVLSPTNPSSSFKTHNDSLVRKRRVAVLLSGRGSNLRVLIEAAGKSDFPASVVLVVADREAEGCQLAKKAGIPTHIVAYAKKEKETFERAVDRMLGEHAVEIVCLAGFMRLLSPWFVARWRNRVLNIHPSLLPSLRGLATHRRALEEGHRQHGCSVHIVTEELDAGEVLGQERLLVEKDDSPESLAERVLKLEHRLYPRVLADYARLLACERGVSKK